MIKRAASYIVGGLVLVVLLVGGLVWYFFVQLSAVSAEAPEEAFTVAQGEGVNQISANLKEAGLIRNQFAFETYIWAQNISSDLKAGEYQLAASMDVPTIVRTIVEGETSREVTITILEGWNADDIGTYLSEEKGLFTKEQWDVAVSVTDSRDLLPNDTFAFLADKPASATLEGYLFPDTYRVFKEATPGQVIEKMLTNFGTRVDDELMAQVEPSGMTLHDVLTLASIVELEVFRDSDRKMVADVFLKRLDAGIGLQSDATVNYATGKSETRPSLDDLDVDSLYNTYKYRGLPPGPIGNPGLSSIVAVVDPEPNPYYYFLTTEEGETIFSETLAEHNENKARYLD